LPLGRSDRATELANLGVHLAELLVSFGVAGISELGDVLERVGRPFTAHIFDTADHHAKAVEVLRLLGSICIVWELLEEPVDELTVLNFLLKGKHRFAASICHNFIVKEVELMVA